MQYTSKLFFFTFGIVFSLGCQPEQNSSDFDPLTSSWNGIEAKARGQTVNMMMWMGDPFVNAYMRDYVIPIVKERYDINLIIGSGQGNQIVSMLMTEIEAGKNESELDMMWINGETFYQLRQIKALYGPFLDHLPHTSLIDLDNPFIGIDFQQPVDGYEAPWGNVQMAIIYDSLRVQNPFHNRAELAEWVRAHPGRFTIDVHFSGMTFLKSLLIDIAGGGNALQGPFDEEAYNRYATELWDYLNGIKKYFWKEGRTFPSGTAQMHQLFMNGEIDYTMSNNDGAVDNQVLQGVFPETSRAYVLDTGTIQNSHYLGIVHNAPHKAGAMVVINFLLSPEAQLKKMDPLVWGDGTVLDLDRLPAPWPNRFRSLPNRRYAPLRETIQDKALQELAPEYMIRLYNDFRSNVITE